MGWLGTGRPLPCPHPHLPQPLTLGLLQRSDEENSDNSNECVVCLSDLRDTLILPCRHLCLCNSCADTLRYQASSCPICRLREWGLCAGAVGGRGRSALYRGGCHRQLHAWCLMGL